MMTIRELEKILIDEHIRVGSYSFSDKQPIQHDGFLISLGKNGKWELFYMERGQKDLLGTYYNEHQVCIEFLKEMSYDDKQLQKYIPKSETIK